MSRHGADGHSVELDAMAVDPVCQMAVTTGDLPHLEDRGRTLWFCSLHYRDELDAHPDRFTAAEPSA